MPVHNELREPTRNRVSWWLRSTTWFAGILYLTLGFAGSTYGHCTAKGKVSGNVLLDFNEDDPLLLVGRMCLALTMTLAFPMLVIPARDIVLRSLPRSTLDQPVEVDTMEALQEPLLVEETGLPSSNGAIGSSSHHIDESQRNHTTTPATSFAGRLVTATIIFWTAGAVASCVESIDIVWDLLGSSLSILLSYLIPCGCYLVICRDLEGQFFSKLLCWIILLVFTPLMIVSTINAVENTFFTTITTTASSSSYQPEV